MVDKSTSQAAESRLARHRRIAGEIYHSPRSAGGHLKALLLSVWIRRGAGFYGLGWIVTFIVLEVQLFIDEWSGSDGFFEFVGGQLLEYVLRVGLLSFLNTLLALLWPLYVLEWFYGYGIVALVAGYFAFEKGLRPGLEHLLPELAQARAEAERKNADKAQAKADRKAGKKKDKKTEADQPRPGKEDA